VIGKLARTDSSICAKLSSLKEAWQTSGFSGSFHDFLRAHLGTDYTLSETQLTELEQSCTICHYLIAENMTLPAVFGPDATPPITCADMTTSLGELAAKYPELTDSDSRYTTILTNFLNHKYGYSLSYYDYLNFKDSVCPVNSVATLYNQAAVQEVPIDSNACVEEQLCSGTERLSPSCFTDRLWQCR
jgi:hypothetical protein